MLGNQRKRSNEEALNKDKITEKTKYELQLKILLDKIKSANMEMNASRKSIDSKYEQIKAIVSGNKLLSALVHDV